MGFINVSLLWYPASADTLMPVGEKCILLCRFPCCLHEAFPQTLLLLLWTLSHTDTHTHTIPITSALPKECPLTVISLHWGP